MLTFMYIYIYIYIISALFYVMFELKQCEHVYSNIKHQAAILSTNIPHPSHKALKIKGARVHREENKGHLLQVRQFGRSFTMTSGKKYIIDQNSNFKSKKSRCCANHVDFIFSAECSSGNGSKYAPVG